MADLIDRQAALDFKVSHGLNENGILYVPYADVKKYLEQLPSAQPEIIRCGYCAHRNQYRFPPKYEVKDYCEVHEKVTTLNNFCSWADRR